MSAIVQQKINDTAGTTGVVTFDNPTAAGNTIIVQWAGINTSGNPPIGTQITDNKGSIYKFAYGLEVSFLESNNILYAHNVSAGVTTVTFRSVMASHIVLGIYEVSGINGSTDPLLTVNGAIGASSPLQASLTFSETAFLIAMWYDYNADSYTGMVGVNTMTYHGTADPYNLMAYKTGQTTTTMNVGVTTGGDTHNIVIVAAFRELPSGSKTITGANTITGGNTITL